MRYGYSFLFSLLLNTVFDHQVCCLPNQSRALPRSPAIELGIRIMQEWKGRQREIVGSPGQLEINLLKGWESFVWKGMEGLWLNTGDGQYFKFVQQEIDRRMEQNVLSISDGQALLTLYKVTNQEKYINAAIQLEKNLSDSLKSVGDDRQLCQAQPFYAEFSALLHADRGFDEIAKQLIEIEKRARDPRTGLLFFGPTLDGGAMGWYGRSLVDVLAYFPAGHPRRSALVSILKRYSEALAPIQDPATGLWRYHPSSTVAGEAFADECTNSLFVYVLAKAAKNNWLPTKQFICARRGYNGLLGSFISHDGRAGNRRTMSDSLTAGNRTEFGAIGAFLMADFEMDANPDEPDRHLTTVPAADKIVLLDYYFNNERHKDLSGNEVRFHYTWEDRANSGFYGWGVLFRQFGFRTDSLVTAPSVSTLEKAAVYIIVDPDNEKEVIAPNSPGAGDIDIIYDWVSRGGVLVLMSNDSANCEFTHFNMLAERFGIHFNWDCYHKVNGNDFEMGAFYFPPGDPIFPNTEKIYIKELSTIAVKSPGRPYFTDRGHVIMATAKIGKGRVFAVGDPWLYNEYTDGRKLPAAYNNFKAARDITRWLIGPARH